MMELGANPVPCSAVIKKCYVMESWSPRMVWIGRNIKNCLVPTPCHWQGHLPLNEYVLVEGA